MKTKKLFCAVLIVCLVLFAAGCGSYSGSGSTAASSAGSAPVSASAPAAPASSAAPAAPAKVTTIKISNQFGVDHLQNLSSLRFKELLEEQSGGAFAVENYPNNQLGTAEVWNDMLINGTLEMGFPGGMMAQSFPLTSVVECPYIFSDWAHVYKCLRENNVLGPMFDDMPEKVGVRSLGIMPIGYRVVSTNKRIETLDDFKGLRLRVPNIAHAVWMAEGLGANVISMNMAELFTALEQGVVDAQENPYNIIVANKLYEVQKFVFDSKHQFMAHNWFVNEKFWQSLTDEERGLVQGCVDEAIDYSYELAEKSEKDSIATIESYGTEVIYPTGEVRLQLAASQQETHQKFFNEYPGSKEYIEKIISMQ